MYALSRRSLLSAGGALAATAFAGAHAPTITGTLPPIRDYGGPSLQGWTTAKGDACWPVDQVGIDDIVRIDFTGYSELQANVNGRAEIMAHNMSYWKVSDPLCLNVSHILEYQFRLPYLPAVTNQDRNGQTVEGSITVWDGKVTRRQTIVGWQWLINPHDVANFGVLQCWTPARAWQPIGEVAVDDTDWHTIRLVLDLARETTSLQFDGTHFPACFARTAGDDSWGDDVSAWVAAETISIYPGTEIPGGKRHEAQFRNWRWTWEQAGCGTAFLPAISGSTR